LIVTNINEWFVFDAVIFDRLFAQNKSLVVQFQEFEAGRLADNRTDFFYKQIAEPYIASVVNEIPFTYFNIRDYEAPLINSNKSDDHKLISLFKLLSPEHLLKLPFKNDSNSLDKRFYSELLHLIGLVEIKAGGKKIIQRNDDGQRNSGSILEDTIIQLDSLDKISRLPKPLQYGRTHNERLFNVGLELTITWVNRILFLKLLEAQLINYHNGDLSYSFLNLTKIRDYDELNSLFFQVLAKKSEHRNSDVKTAFEKVPYLNSSLFEPTELEQVTLFISNLKDEKQLPIISSTILKSANGKKLSGNITTLDYLFNFLNAYDFTSEGSEDIQEENKSLINASVLGLIFEKINGYKDGSFFTPGFITMYICRETIRKSVIQKFNQIKAWDCVSIDDLYDRIDDRHEANDIINSIKICDPAVGSGHFLVSALNEIISVKNDLKILQDYKGRRLKEYQVEVVNDELIITDEEGRLFQYVPSSAESHRVQQALFHEKQTVIENCLFGVDINPNSVKICRLRLWIELLKNAYYKHDRELETLPNIDINIKCGNSIVSRFDINVDLKQALKKRKYTIESYRNAVQTYRNAESKEQKREMEQLITDIKSDFRTEINKNSKENTDLLKLEKEFYLKYNTSHLFDEKLNSAQIKHREILVFDIEKLKKKIEDIRNNKIFEDAFEWRFEFPEVLDDFGDFIGFDAIIGNPPYIRQEEIIELKQYLQSSYKSYVGTADLFVYFMELGINILKNGGNFTYIIPNKWMKAGYGMEIRKLVKSNHIDKIIDFGDLPVFEEASTYPSILSISKGNPKPDFYGATVTTLDLPEGISQYIYNNQKEILVEELNDNGWTLSNTLVQQVLIKIKGESTPLGVWVNNKMYRGILTGFNEAFIIDDQTRDYLISKDDNCALIIKPFLDGKDIKKYQTPKAKKWIIFTKRGFLIEQYPVIHSHLHTYINELTPRAKDSTLLKGRKPGSYKWFEIQDSVDYHTYFEQNKIVWAETSLGSQFCMVGAGVYLNKTAFMIPSQDLALLAILNSKLVEFYLDSIVSKVRGGYFSMSKAYVETIPICYPEESDSLVEKVKNIIESKSLNPQADCASIEREIDKIVYELYNLSADEIKIIEMTIKRKP
jgi:adenine-specific DNA-methyltransferase